AEVDTSTYLTKGHVTVTGRTLDHGTDFDFYPGEYSKTWVFASDNDPLSILDALRSGSMFTVLGGLVDRLELFASTSSESAKMGESLDLDRKGESVQVTIRLRIPQSTSFGDHRPTLHHLDIIAGEIIGRSADRDALTNPTTRLVAQLKSSEA